MRPWSSVRWSCWPIHPFFLAGYPQWLVVGPCLLLVVFVAVAMVVVVPQSVAMAVTMAAVVAVAVAVRG